MTTHAEGWPGSSLHALHDGRTGMLSSFLLHLSWEGLKKLGVVAWVGCQTRCCVYLDISCELGPKQARHATLAMCMHLKQTPCCIMRRLHRLCCRKKDDVLVAAHENPADRAWKRQVRTEIIEYISFEAECLYPSVLLRLYSNLPPACAGNRSQ